MFSSGKKQLLFILLLSISYTHQIRGEEEAFCGYASCPTPQDGKLNVHLICHSHDDVGWLKTVDQYFYGSNRQPWNGDQENQRAGVQYILDSVMKELAFDPTKKFIQVETAFFWRWWNEQNEVMKDLVRDLVANGQLHFIGGGWSMNDEAAAHYQAIIDQMSLGLIKLNHTFPNGCANPKVAWQIDPFGHSKEQASIFAQMGFDGLFFGRLDWRDKDTRLSNLSMETLWNAGYYREDELFTGVLYNYYSPPPGFCWDLLCNDEPLMDNPTLHDYNVDTRINDFITYVKNQGSHFRTNHVAITTGMDFHYTAAHAWFMNLDKLIKYINEKMDTGVHVMYSTPTCYLKNLREANEAWPVKEGDFFPYASDYHAYWSGYFTSRPTSKFMIRDASRVLQAAKQITVKKYFDPNCDENCKLDLLEATETLDRAVGVAQHHDAITGTEQDYVAEDYHNRLDSALYRIDYTLDGGAQCKYLNMSVCDISGSSETQIPSDEEFRIFVYNPLGQSFEPMIRFPIKGTQWIIKDENLLPLASQVLKIPQAVMQMPGRKYQMDIDHEIVFKSPKIPAVSQAKFYVKPSSSSVTENHSKFLKRAEIFETQRGKYYFDGEKLSAFQSLDGTFYNFTQEYFYYIGHRGNNTEFDFRASGAYIFRPESSEPIKLRNPTEVKVEEGEFYFQLEMEFESFASQLLRIPKKLDDTLADIEVEWMIGPIPIEDQNGKEFIHKVTMNHWNNQGEFYTDANGRQNLKRIRDQRPDYDISNATFEEPIASNYYPINAWISMQNQETDDWISILTDRSQGGSSITDDTLELMLHRRLLDDDAFGVAQPLNETEFETGLVARGTHYLLFSNSKQDMIRRTRLLANRIFRKPMVSLRNYQDSETVVKPSGSYELPENVNLLTLAIIPETHQLLLRLEHLFAPGEDPEKSQITVVSLQELLSNSGYGLGEVIEVQETTLGGDRWKTSSKEDLEKWKTQVPLTNPQQEKGEVLGPEFLVILDPFQIRSFIVTIQRP